MWCQAMAERTADVSDALSKRLQELHQKYGMRLPTVDDRLAERFVRPLALDRVRALVAPAVDDARHGRSSEAFERLEQETDELTARADRRGVGRARLAARAGERSAQSPRTTAGAATASPGSGWVVVQRPLSMHEIVEQLADWPREPL